MWRIIEQFRTRAGGFFDGIGGLICCAAFGSILFIFRKRIPHPSEFFPFNWLSLKLGIHKHENFNLLLDILEAFEIKESGKYSIRVKCGRETQETLISLSSDDTVRTLNKDNNLFKCIWKEKRVVFVRQREDYLFLELINHGTFTNSVVGECKINIMDIFEAKFPKKVIYNIQRDRKGVARVVLSFYRISPNIIVEDNNPVLFQAIINLQTDADIIGNKYISANPDKMSEKEQLVFFSKALQGNLYYLENGNKDKLKMFYFRAVETTLNRWEWCYWVNEGDYLKGSSKLGGYPFLAMSVVIPDKSDRDRIYIKYHDLYGTHDLFFKTVDIERDIWSEALYEFIDRLRTYLNHIKEGNTEMGLSMDLIENENSLDSKIERTDCSVVDLERACANEVCSKREIPGEYLQKTSNPTSQITGRTRALKKYIVEDTGKDSKERPNSPGSIRKMKMEVSPIRHNELDPLIKIV